MAKAHDLNVYSYLKYVEDQFYPVIKDSTSHQLTTSKVTDALLKYSFVLFLTPVNVRLRVSRESLKSADAATASSLMIMPRSCACCFSAAVDSAVSLKRVLS